MGFQPLPFGVRYAAYPDDLPLPASAVQMVNGKRPTDPLADFVRCPSAAGTVWLGLLRWLREKGPEAFWGPDPKETVHTNRN